MVKIICAIDTHESRSAIELLEVVHPFIDVIKLGLEFFCSLGPNGLEQIARKFSKPIFLDLKLHDIPNTVAKTIKALKDLPIEMLTIHILSGAAALQEAKNALQGSKIKLIGVTILTSLNEVDLKHFSINANLSEYVVNLAKFGQQNDLAGVVCSALESDEIKKHCGEEFLTITPGISAATVNHDQKRTIKIEEIKNYNTDYIVVGRAISGAKNPGEAAKFVWDKLNCA